MTYKRLILGSVAALLAATPLASAREPSSSNRAAGGFQDGHFSLTTGLDYSSGTYGGASSTDILYLPVVGKYETDKWIFKLTVPYIEVTGPGNVVRDVGVVHSRQAGTRRTESGLGDIVGAVTRNLFDFRNSGTLIDLTGKIKFGTADAAKGLGTGENDYAAQIDVTQRVTSTLSAFGSLGYKFIGSPPGSDLNNVLYGEGGAVVRLNESFHAGAMLDASEAPSPTSGEQREVTAYLTDQLSQRWKLQIYGVKGFADGSPDWGGGAMATVTF